MKKVPETLHYLIKEILEEKKISAGRTVEFLQRADIDEKELIDYITHNHPRKESYGRSIVFDGGFFKLMIMSWNPNDFTAIHDHGQVEWGAVKFFGEMVNLEYLFDNEILKLKSNETTKKGDVAKVTADLIHQTGNQTGKPLLTMHLYGSNKVKENLTLNARIFDSIEKRIYYTTGAAYLKLPSEIILKKDENLGVDIKSFEYDKLIRMNFFNQNKNIFKDELRTLNQIVC